MDREKILALYFALHAAGVVHGTASPKHWIWDGVDPESMRLVDWGASYIRDGGHVPPEMKGDWEALEDWVFEQEAEAELGSVRSKMGLA